MRPGIGRGDGGEMRKCRSRGLSVFFLLEEIVVFCAVFRASLPTIADAVSRGEEGEGTVVRK
jgi:hypothetical protein